MEFIIFIFLALIAYNFLPLFTQGNQSKEAQSYNYQQREVLFTRAEHSFFFVLNDAVSAECKVLGKVRVADILTPQKTNNRSHWQFSFNKISAKHFDYVLCDKETLKVVAVIELDDKSHQTKKVVLRDEFLEDACDSANLPLVRFAVQRSYSIEFIRENIFNALKSKSPKSEDPGLIS